MQSLTTRAINETEPSTILQRIAERDKTAVKDCIDAYGNFIWALAKNFTRSPEEAAAATEKIFVDIWQYGECAGGDQSIEKKLIVQIALRRLITRRPSTEQKFVSKIDATNEQGAGTGEIF